MGAAKRRGTFEQRKAIAVKRNAEMIREQRFAEIAKKQAMTPEERAKKTCRNALIYFIWRSLGKWYIDAL